MLVQIDISNLKMEYLFKLVGIGYGETAPEVLEYILTAEIDRLLKAGVIAPLNRIGIKNEAS